MTRIPPRDEPVTITLDTVDGPKTITVEALPDGHPPAEVPGCRTILKVSNGVTLAITGPGPIFASDAAACPPVPAR